MSSQSSFWVKTAGIVGAGINVAVVAYVSRKLYRTLSSIYDENKQRTDFVDRLWSLCTLVSDLHWALFTQGYAGV